MTSPATSPRDDPMSADDEMPMDEHGYVARVGDGTKPHSVGFDLTVVGQIKTFTGMYVTPHNLTAEMVNIDDIAHALSRICRFGGHCAGFLSVAEHSVHVSRLVPPEFQLDALLHDASEAYLGDMCRPLKRMEEMQAYRDAEQRAERAVAEFFGLTYPMPDVVRRADSERLKVEIATLRDDPDANTPPWQAEAMFLHAYRQIRGGA